MGFQNSEYITFPNWAAQKPKQQLCGRPEEAQPMSDLCQAILQVYCQHLCTTAKWSTYRVPSADTSFCIKRCLASGVTVSLQACRAADSSEEVTLLCLVKTSQWAYAQCVALADLVPWQAYQRVLFYIAVSGLETAVRGWVDSYISGSNKQLLVDSAPQLLHVLEYLKQHGESYPWHQNPYLISWDQLVNWETLHLTEHYAYTTPAAAGQDALASALSYQQTDRYAHTAAEDQEQRQGAELAWHNSASPVDASLERATSLSTAPDVQGPECTDVAMSDAEEGFEPGGTAWLNRDGAAGTDHMTAPLQQPLQQHGTAHCMELDKANTASSIRAEVSFPESCFADSTTDLSTLQPVGGKSVVNMMVDAQGNPAEPYMLSVASSAAGSTMDSVSHARVPVKVAPESIPEVQAFMQHVSAIMSRAQTGDDSAILQMHQMCQVALLGNAVL